MRNYWKLRLSSVGVFILFISVFNAFGQFEEDKTEKEGYYLFPIKPGTRNTLAGTMGELRSSHFHTGIDIRTEGRTGLPVYASAEGYISRIAISTSGYGNAVYIAHPNGHTTVYAHLNEFYGPITDYIREEQYQQKTFALNLFFKKEQFKVTRGDTIAFSGNSGSSGGPHLHYDIRDQYQRPLNPLKYGFDEILDHTPPEAQKIAIKTLNKEARVEGQFGRMEYNVRRIGNNYVIDKPIEVFGEIGIELYAYDKLDNSRFRCGINFIEMNVNGKNVFEQTIKSFSFSEQKDIYQHMSYETALTSGVKYHKMYIDDGNHLGFYNVDKNKGKLNLKEDGLIPIKIAMKDSYGNESFIEFRLQVKRPSTSLTGSDNIRDDFQVIDNTFVFKVPSSTKAPVVLNGTKLSPTYTINDNNIYLHDLRVELPEVLEANSTFKSFNFKDKIPPGKDYKYYNSKMDVYFSKEVLFDTLYFENNYLFDSINNQEIFEIGNKYTPLRKSIKVTLKPHPDYNEKFRVYSLDNRGNPSFERSNWESDKISFYTRSFGRYTLLADTIAPTVIPLVINKNELKFKIKDDLSGLNEFDCYVDEKWVLMNYDYKRELLWSEKLDKNKPFSGNVLLIVTDNTGNKKEYKTQIK
jgi:hypothetical protein